jgi:heptosyltransferase-2
MISLLGSEKLKNLSTKIYTHPLLIQCRQCRCEYIFNYFPKQIDDAKTVLTVVKPSTQYIDLLGGDLKHLLRIESMRFNCEG